MAIKYVNTAVTFREIPDEITLCINISNCNIHCKYCHSKYLWEDTGEELTLEALHNLIKVNKGITCICFMGGNYEELSPLIISILEYTNIKIAWYTGLDIVNALKAIGNYDRPHYLKVGSYCSKLGGLASITTNQRLYKIDIVSTESANNNEIVLTDITNKLQHES